ncbi:hypothetical protein BU15DRAFT_66845 [Melanogaster broomeanus]|nr:hypothetical protein BU15DRAFT_66845 [Melanogaster broomeanus]
MDGGYLPSSHSGLSVVVPDDSRFELTDTVGVSLESNISSHSLAAPQPPSPPTISSRCSTSSEEDMRQVSRTAAFHANIERAYRTKALGRINSNPYRHRAKQWHQALRKKRKAVSDMLEAQKVIEAVEAEAGEFVPQEILASLRSQYYHVADPASTEGHYLTAVSDIRLNFNATVRSPTRCASGESFDKLQLLRPRSAGAIAGKQRQLEMMAQELVNLAPSLTREGIVSLRNRQQSNLNCSWRLQGLQVCKKLAMPSPQSQVPPTYPGQTRSGSNAAPPHSSSKLPANRVPDENKESGLEEVTKNTVPAHAGKEALQVVLVRVEGLMGWVWTMTWVILCSSVIIDGWARAGLLGSPSAIEGVAPLRALVERSVMIDDR